jgi:hypothetical protein
VYDYLKQLGLTYQDVPMQYLGYSVELTNAFIAGHLDVISDSFERYRALFVERLGAEVTKPFQEQELAEMLDTRIK